MFNSERVTEIRNYVYHVIPVYISYGQIYGHASARSIAYMYSISEHLIGPSMAGRGNRAEMIIPMPGYIGINKNAGAHAGGTAQAKQGLEQEDFTLFQDRINSKCLYLAK